MSWNNAYSNLRKGKWTQEEEAYANKIIDLFNRGLLAIPAGTTLRSYLSDKLRCDPMRITKKYAGTQCIGKQIFQPTNLMPDEDFELIRMERAFLSRISSKVDEEDSGTRRTTSRHGSSPRPILLPHAPDRSGGGLLLQGGALGMGAMAAMGAVNGWKGKRIRSAPDLTELGHHPHPPLKTSSLPSPVHAQTYDVSSGGGGGVKRSHSVMALMDFDRLVGDDHAAGELFLEFVSQMDTKRPHTEALPVPSTATDQDHAITQAIALSMIQRPVEVDMKAENAQEVIAVIESKEEDLTTTDSTHSPPPQQPDDEADSDSNFF